MVTLDANEAVASVAHRLTKSLPSIRSRRPRRWANRRTSGRPAGKQNIWGTIPQVTEMQSEGGRHGAVHGALQAGALATTFTASQGLLLMIPNMYKIAGELTSLLHARRRPHAGHARAVDLRRPLRRHGLPPDRVSPCSAPTPCRRPTTSPASPRRPRSRAACPFLHFFDGFRTSHEVAKIERVDATTTCAR